MAFHFSWPIFSASFYRDAREMLSQALNKGEKPAIIADRIEVRELNMGTVPPELEMLEIGDLSKERFRGIFRLSYSGDAFIELQTTIQANPLNQHKPTIDALTSPSILFASAPLKVPMRLKLSGLRLRAIIVLVVSRAKGITLVFKNDPLESVTVSSTFDSVAVIQGFIQREIEGQLREMFRADLPGIIHRLSQRWLADTARATPETRNRFDPGTRIETKTEQTGDITSMTLRSRPPSVMSLSGSPPRRTMPHRPSTASLASSATAAVMMPRLASDLDNMSVAESIESYDPSYGLRPDGLAGNSPVRLQGRIFSSGSTGSRGLGDVLLEETDDEDIPEADESCDLTNMSDFSQLSPSTQEYESYPAIGGGFITRPRVLHAQSQLSVPGGARSRSPSSTASASPRVMSGTSSPIAWRRASGMSMGTEGSTRLAQSMPVTPLRTAPPSHYLASSSSTSKRQVEHRSAGSSSYTSPRTPFSRGASSLFVPTTASSHTSIDPSSRPASPPFSADDEAEPHKEAPPSPPPLRSPATVGITLTTAANNDRTAHMRTLGQTHSTLSPLTRHLEHVAARSHVLTRASSQDYAASTTSRGPQKARRRRLHVFGESKALPVERTAARQRTITENSLAWEEGSDNMSIYFPRSDSPEAHRSML